MKFAYADPPYVGCAAKHYASDPKCAEVDHQDLIAKLCQGYPDGWALSCSSPSLQGILALCPSDVRIGSWVKPFCSFKKNVTVAYAWEPVIFRGGRKIETTELTVRDWLDAPAVKESITLRKGLSGAKPKEFCFWMFDVLNIELGDELDDLFPGTGIVAECFREYVSKTALHNRGLFDEFVA